MVARSLKKFLKCIFSRRYSLITNTVCYITLLGTADVAQQMLSGASLFPKDQCNSPPESGDAQCKTEKSGGIQKNNAKSVDWLRARRVASVGLITGPMNTFWYRYLDRVLVPGPVSPPQICKKVIVDILSSPAFDSVFIITVAMQEGSTFIEGLTEYTQKCRKIFLLNISVWIPTQTLNFWLVPIRFRVLYVMSVSFVYNCILTYIKHKDSDIHGNSK
ncbi:mpv17 / PMP22 family domain-containing protein [Ditylenchus destructor]|nr:mpv17 / PMP22 family domain-containing protein [Ditylenchus destructor]